MRMIMIAMALVAAGGNAVSSVALAAPPTRVWRANWIAAPDTLMQDWRAKDAPAPVFRKTAVFTNKLSGASLFICGLGYFHCLVDGNEVSDIELCPTPTQYDRRWRYRRFPLPVLAAGTHELTVEVGDGLYRSATTDAWHFDKATWLDYPKLICEVVDADGGLVLKTDRSWHVCHGPTVHTALRGGETYDARREGHGEWMQPRILPGPGGLGEEETLPPCRVVAVHEMKRLGNGSIYDAGVHLSGVPRLTVCGTAGATVMLQCGEKLCGGGKAVSRDQDALVRHTSDFQRDVYILKGWESETWRPRFTYHGFRYVQVAIDGEARVKRLEALEINTDFPRIGSIRTSDPVLTAIERKAMQSVRSNYVGNPTDCPQREKNGWFSEARLQNEALLYEYDAGAANLAFVATALDTQRPGGQLSCMAPTSGWGYTWGSGPAWESGPFLMAEQVHRFTGDKDGLIGVRDALARHMTHLESLVDERGIVDFGLGDWLAPQLDWKKPQYVRHSHSSWNYPEATNVPSAYLQTAFFKRELDLMAEIETLAGRPAAAEPYRIRAREISAALRRTYGYPDSTTCLALALEHGLCEPNERRALAARLVAIVRRNAHRVDYGTLGSGCVLRALFENGYADDAYRMMVQPDYPGYGHFANDAALTTFPEYWSVYQESLNHGAFADVVACLFRYLGGIRHVSHRPGRAYVEIRPSCPKDLSDFSVKHDGYSVSWRREGAEIVLDIVIPTGKEAAYVQPDGVRRMLRAGTHRFRHVRKSWGPL